MKIVQVLCLVMLLLGIVAFASSDDNSVKVYPVNVDEILYQRDLHGATQAYLWGQAIATSEAWMDGNLRVADYIDYVTYVTPFEKRFIITSMLEAEKLGYAQSIATSACRISDPQLAHSCYYPGKNWSKIPNLTSIETHIDPVSKAMDLDALTSYAHEACSMSIDMTEDQVGVGSKYLAAYQDADQNWLNGDHV